MDECTMCFPASILPLAFEALDVRTCESKWKSVLKQRTRFDFFDIVSY